nr:MAG TPA: hypothetical protein [Caudoviricetes sp.]
MKSSRLTTSRYLANNFCRSARYRLSAGPGFVFA